MEFEEKLSKLNKKQSDFVVAMLETDNIAKSAKLAHITEQTAHNYLKNGLSSQIENIRKKYIRENLKRLEYASLKATDVLIGILEDEKCPKSVKLNASKSILDYSLKIREQTEIIERLEGIEKRINEKEN